MANLTSLDADSSQQVTPYTGRQQTVLPGFGLSLGITVVMLSLIVMLPLAAVVIESLQLSATAWQDLLQSERIRHALGVSIGTALAAALANVLLGGLLAWVLVRYEFPGRRLLDALIDLPFALPTAVAGIALTALYSADGWFGRWLLSWGIEVNYQPLGITLALLFIGLPFVVRTVQPVLGSLPQELEAAASTLGASRWQIFYRIVLPLITPALLTGFTLALARGIGEYGSVIFIAGNIPFKTEIAPLLIVSSLEEYDYATATAIAVMMLAISFVLLIVINLLQARLSARFSGGRLV